MNSRAGGQLTLLCRCRESWIVVIVVGLVKAGWGSCRLQRAGCEGLLARSGRSQCECYR
jgi:hypothetical protein